MGLVVVFFMEGGVSSLSSKYWPVAGSKPVSDMASARSWKSGSVYVLSYGLDGDAVMVVELLVLLVLFALLMLFALLVSLVELPTENENDGAAVEVFDVVVMLFGVPKLKDGAVLAELLKENIELEGLCNCDVVELPNMKGVGAAGALLDPKLKGNVLLVVSVVIGAVSPLVMLDRPIAHIAALLTKFKCTNGTFLSPPWNPATSKTTRIRLRHTNISQRFRSCSSILRRRNHRAVSEVLRSKVA